MDYPWPTPDYVLPHSRPTGKLTETDADRDDNKDLVDVLTLVARAFSASYAFVLVPQSSKTVPVIIPPYEVSWSDFVWHRDGPVAEKRLRRNLVATALRAILDAPTRETSVSGPHLIVPLPGPAGTIYGYAGIEADQHWSADDVEHTRRMLRDLFAGYFQTTRTDSRVDDDAGYWSDYVESVPEPMVIATLGQIVHINKAATRLLGGDLPFVFEGRSLLDFVPSNDQDVVREYSTAEAGSGGIVREHSIIRLDGEERRVEARRSPIECGGVPSVQISFSDVTKYWRGVEDLRCLVGTLSEAVVSISLDEMIPVSASESIQVRQIRHKGRVRECNGVLCDFYGIDAETIKGKTIDSLIWKAELDLLRTFVRSGYKLNDYTHRVQIGGSQRLFRVNAVGKTNKGCLTQILASFREITEEIDLERLASDVQEMQQEKIGRDLHDSLGPYLTGVRLLSGELAERDSLSPAELKSRVEKIAGFTEEASRQLRKIYNGLVPVAAESGSLAVALSSIAETFNAFSGSTVTFVQYGEFEEVERSQLVQIHRIAQEAVTNALKHGKPTKTEICARRDGDALMLTVQDNGKGFDTSVRSNRKSLGMENMAWRARSLGGTFAVTSAPGEGTTITCRLPLA